MKFLVYRTSTKSLGTIPQPCEEAYVEEAGGEQKWFVDLDNLEALIAFMQKYDSDIIVSLPEPIWGKPYFGIEIYDTWKE